MANLREIKTIYICTFECGSGTFKEICDFNKTKQKQFEVYKFS